MTQRYTLSPDAITQEVDGEIVILDLGSEQYFSLDEVGTRIWQLLGENRTLPEVVDTLLAEYEVDRETLEADLTQLLASLKEAGLASPQEES